MLKLFNEVYFHTYSEAGPLMISPTGQIIIPSTCPGSLLIDFITTNLEEAAEKQRIYQSLVYIYIYIYVCEQ